MFKKNSFKIKRPYVFISDYSFLNSHWWLWHDMKRHKKNLDFSLSMHSQSPIYYVNPNELQMSNLQYQRVMVDQLTRESGISRINVSVAIRDLMVSPIFYTSYYLTLKYLCLSLQKYINEKEHEDYLLSGFPPQKNNPFREKSSCVLF